MSQCPLCEARDCSLFHEDATRRIQRPYYRCHCCQLVFVPQSFFLSTSAEKAEYDLHENHGDDPGYRQFLNRFSTPYCQALQRRFPDQDLRSLELLEFGCGPGPVLADMLKACGFSVSLYDAFYHPDASQLVSNRFHGISATEVIEHLHEPRRVFTQWVECLKPGGVLGVMTKRVKNQSAFASWHYKNDPTHVCFFSEATFVYLADAFALKYEQVEEDVALFFKI